MCTKKEVPKITHKIWNMCILLAIHSVGWKLDKVNIKFVLAIYLKNKEE
jgi:predicted membrane protein